MSSAVPKHAIVLDRGTIEERGAIQAIVKEHANGWWHRATDMWIVGGGTASDWTDKIRTILPGAGPSSVIVLSLGEGWAFYGPNSAQKAEWLHTHL